MGYENEFGGSLRGFPSSSILSLPHGAVYGLPLMFRDSGSHFQGEAELGSGVTLQAVARVKMGAPTFTGLA